jgi:peptide/nickel transport system substrate-binding protein
MRTRFGHGRFHTTRLGLFTAAALVAATAVVSVGEAAPASRPGSAEPVMGGHITISGEAEVGSPWTPAAMRCDSYCFMRARTFFDPVAVFGTDGEVHGMLAESIEPNDDYTEWTITIREGISFTDGTPVDAHAVEYNLQAAGTGILISALLKDVAKVPDPENPDHMLLKIEVVDDNTLVIYTGDGGDPQAPLPWRNFPHTLTGQWGLIASPQWLESVAEDPELAAQPVGSGPFTVDSYEPRGSLEVSRNPDYWMTDEAGNQLPYLDSITFRVIEDSEISAEALRAGDLDMVGSSNGRAITTIMGLGDEFDVTVQDEYMETGYLMIDLDKPGPLQDRRVRCAMSLAIDRDELNAATTDGFSESANGLFSPGQQGYLEDNGLSIDQDLETAAAMIAEYEAETGEDVSFTLGHTPSNVVVQGAELFMGWWTEIGIDVDDQTIPQNDLINLAVFGVPEFQVFSWRQHWGVFVDQQYLWWHSENAFPDGELSLNFARLRDPGVDDALDEARMSATDEEAIAAAEEINRIFAEQCYNIPLNWLAWAVLSNPRVQGLGNLTLPDGTPVLDGGSAAGSFWVQTLWLDEG